jgi:hypothetical protein
MLPAIGGAPSAIPGTNPLAAIISKESRRNRRNGSASPR